ncbi:MAG: hypothetical protein IPP31_04115 [Chitinophagaceae bacterium]|nr:hypothetical protein [Chitinophagaceae bacterium]
MPIFRHILILLIFLLPAAAMAQYPELKDVDVTGLWKGTMHNDTTGRNLRYEIAISENKGKLYGYSHTFFIVNDQEYFGLKKVKVKRDGDKVIIQDQELIANNYPIPPAKGVRQLDVLTLELRDSLMILSGPFSTNPTKVYSVLTGSIYVQRKNNYRQSALVPHLEELGLAKDLSFVVPEFTALEIAAIAQPVIGEQSVNAVAKTDNKNKVKIKESRNIPVDLKIDTTRAIVAKTDPGPVKEIKNAEPVKAVVAVPTGPAANVNNRRIETVQSVNIKSDSLVLTLYDNGEVDGDTVSVLMNGKVIMPRIGLSTRAVRKTIYLTPDMPDSIQLIMYAENLGSIAPNTGLLVVHDGEDIYEIRFSGDMTKNSAIVFRRRK